MELLEIIKKIDEIFKDETIRNRYVDEEDGFIKDEYRNKDVAFDHPELESLLEKLDEGLCGEMITPQGQADFFKMKKLSQMGGELRVNFRAGEKDSFGWLTGVLQTRYFNYCYG